MTSTQGLLLFSVVLSLPFPKACAIQQDHSVSYLYYTQNVELTRNQSLMCEMNLDAMFHLQEPKSAESYGEKILETI